VFFVVIAVVVIGCYRRRCVLMLSLSSSNFVASVLFDMYSSKHWSHETSENFNVKTAYTIRTPYVAATSP